ncbi:hypothetical protein [uncultured Ilyobacter sp.]|uniref:hypothetical protein n=1 Tax=uncultured Ilyobacter sp. TaxID=544433 RepID=UPI0029BFC80F|nr:hypothetical protein [uncultured Ilyobacter sp.]
MDTVDIRIKNAVVDDNLIRERLNYKNAIIDTENGDLKSNFRMNERQLEALNINYIGEIKIRETTVEIIKLSIPKAYGFKNNVSLITSENQKGLAFENLKRDLEKIGVSIDFKFVEYTRIDYPFHIAGEDFNDWQKPFRVLMAKDFFKEYRVIDKYDRSMYTGITHSETDVELNIYNKSYQMEKKETESQDRLWYENDEIIRIEIKLIGVRRIRMALGDKSDYKSISLKMIKDYSRDYFLKKFRSAMKTAAGDMFYYIDILDGPSTLKKKIFLRQDEIACSSIFCMAIKSYGLVEGWEAEKTNSMLKTSRKAFKQLEQVNRYTFDSLEKLNKLYNIVSGQKKSLKRAVSKYMVEHIEDTSKPLEIDI